MVDFVRVTATSAWWLQGARDDDEEAHAAAAMPRLVPQEDELAGVGAAGALQCLVAPHSTRCQLIVLRHAQALRRLPSFDAKRN